MSEWQHIYPVKDLKPHNTESHPHSMVECSIEADPFNPKLGRTVWPSGCECCPYIDFTNSLVIHNAFDCREAFEEAEKILGIENPENGS